MHWSISFCRLFLRWSCLVFVCLLNNPFIYYYMYLLWLCIFIRVQQVWLPGALTLVRQVIIQLHLAGQVSFIKQLSSFYCNVLFTLVMFTYCRSYINRYSRHYFQKPNWKNQSHIFSTVFHFDPQAHFTLFSCLGFIQRNRDGFSPLSSKKVALKPCKKKGGQNC